MRAFYRKPLSLAWLLKLSREGTEVLQLKNILYTSDLLSAFGMRQHRLSFEGCIILYRGGLKLLVHVTSLWLIFYSSSMLLSPFRIKVLQMGILSTFIGPNHENSCEKCIKFTLEIYKTLLQLNTCISSLKSCCQFTSIPCERRVLLVA